MTSRAYALRRVLSAFASTAFLPVGVAVFVITLGDAAAQDTGEQPPTFSASQILNGQDLTGPNYRISETVHNDGFLNNYTVTVEGKAYRVAGNAMMRQRLKELEALQYMEKLSRADVYGSAAKKAATSSLRTLKGLLTKPVGTVKGITRGVGTFFSGIGHSLFGGSSEQEEGVVKTMLGFDIAKRQFAYRFGIDPYTSFPPVRERLNEISWSSTAGGLTVSVAFKAIPGAGGAIASMGKTANTMNQLIRDNTPAELKKINAARLERMNVSSGAVEIFLEHPKFSPSEKTRLIDALASMGITGREQFIHRAVQAEDETTAVFLRRWAEMFAAYHRRIKPIERLVRVGKAPFAQRADGVLVGLFPIDHLAWTGAITRRHAANMQSLTDVSGVTGGEVWIEGTISAKAEQALKAQGWVVTKNAGNYLGLGN